LIEHDKSVWSVAISPDEQTFVSGSDDKTIKVWNLHTGELNRTLEGHSGMVNSVAISTDGQILVSGSRDNTLKVWGMP
jgi:WD40 repeat protein